jgi:carbamoyl-phosphate synthase large subunit
VFTDLIGEGGRLDAAQATDLKILVIGSGPIVIGQACEFDYSGAQACKVLMEDGYEVVLVNSNPATIMTDPAGDAHLRRAHHRRGRRADHRQGASRTRCCPRWAGRPASTAPSSWRKNGTLDKYGVEMIGCDLEAIQPRRGPQALPRP